MEWASAKCSTIFIYWDQELGRPHHKALSFALLGNSHQLNESA